ncbi:hypothetical protein BJF97_01760 [Klebsiella sp. LTGPAF-6F]|nr:hypothetical protein BJF97_01760 [Klebsiella sp. LTGPAF-6F]
MADDDDLMSARLIRAPMSLTGPPDGGEPVARTGAQHRHPRFPPLRQPKPITDIHRSDDTIMVWL